MISKTKYPVTEAQIAEMYRVAGFGTPLEIRPLSDGEFNAVYAVDTERGKTVVKIASNADVLTHERGMMAAELQIYELMRSGGMRVPEIYYTAKAGEVIGADWFIMEYIDGQPMPLGKGTAQEKAARLYRLGADVARLHSIPVSGYGYLQMGLKNSWSEAFCGMVSAIIDDAKRFGKRTRRAEKLLRRAQAMKAELDAVSPVLVNFDIFALNLLETAESGNRNPVWIDPERSFFGDPIAEFVMLEFDKKLEQKGATVDGYRSLKSLPIGKGEKKRWCLYVGYLAAIMEVEKYSRYTPKQKKYWFNVFASAFLYLRAFRGLK